MLEKGRLDSAIHAPHACSIKYQPTQRRCVPHPLDRRGVETDVVTFNSLINVLRWGGQRAKALEVLEGMNSKGGEGAVRPDVVTYNSAIAACASG